MANLAAQSPRVRPETVSTLNRDCRRNQPLFAPSQSLFRLIPAPNPNECICQRLLENPAIAVAGPEAENESVVVTFGRECRFRPLSRHDPVVMGVLRIIWAQILFRHMCENSQRLLVTVFNELHS